MYKLLKIQDYAMTRDLILKNLDNNQVFRVFDDTDLSSEVFEFVRVGETYDCKISIYAQPSFKQSEYKVKSKEYRIVGLEEVAGYKWLKIEDNNKNVFYVDEKFEKYREKRKLSLLPLRYDIISVNGLDRTY